MTDAITATAKHMMAAFFNRVDREIAASGTAGSGRG
jgi:hypothetical protein